jgi:hypothetical protein
LPMPDVDPVTSAILPWSEAMRLNYHHGQPD